MFFAGSKMFVGRCIVLTLPLAACRPLAHALYSGSHWILPPQDSPGCLLTVGFGQACVVQQWPCCHSLQRLPAKGQFEFCRHRTAIILCVVEDVDKLLQIHINNIVTAYSTYQARLGLDLFCCKRAMIVCML